LPARQAEPNRPWPAAKTGTEPAKRTVIRTLLVSILPAASANPDPPARLDLSALDLESLLTALAALVCAGLLATLRRAMAQSSAERVLQRAKSDGHRERLRPLLERIEPLTTSASVLETTASLLFALNLVRVLSESEVPGWGAILFTLGLGVPVLWFATDALARAIAQRSGDALLARVLPAFEALQLPLAALAWVFQVVRRGVLRALGVRDDAEATRQIVAGLREVIADAEIRGSLDATEREIIGNVMEFRDVDVAAVMTPRTEISAAEVEDGLLAAAQTAARSGHSRIPVYEGTLDTIIGTVSARDLVQVMAAGRLESTSLRQILHPAYFVPETKRISELLAELRREKIKMAIVLDEYGGTAGLVTVGDILSEIVGDIPDEYDEDEESPVRHLARGEAEVDASLHVSEVNEALDIEIPEEKDFETLGGFVLAELGHFPRQGESFVHGEAEFEVLEANDRRVLKVRIRRLEPARSNP
jgi:putative hemolysin